MDNMEDVLVVTINGEDYIIVDEIEIDKIKYVYLAKENDPENFFIRKINIINNNQCIVNLDSEDEVTKALKAFAEKNHQ